MDTPLMNCFSRDAQAELLVALQSHDIHAFRQILDTHNVDLEAPNDDNYLSIFHYACQLADCHEFVAECIEYGCDVNKLNDHFQKTSINFAVESLDLANIALIANQLHTNLDHKYEHQTPLNFLASKLTDSNFKLVFECIRLLIGRQANPNIPNQREITPIINILKNKEISHDRKEEILKYLLDNAPDIDLDNYRKGEARKLLTQHFPNLDLPPVAEKLKWSFATLMRALINGKESTFLRGLSEIYTELQNDSHELDKLFCEHEADETLLIVAARRSYELAMERMIRLGANVNYKIRKNLSPIEVACQHGRWKVLQLLLNAPNIELRTAEPLLSIVVKRIGDEITDVCNYTKCFDLLINHPGMDIDRSDMNGCSALHYAVSYSNQSLVLQLLEKGAYIGVNNKFDHLAINDINPKILETHLNSCITTNGSRSGEDQFEIIFDYMNLVPDCYKPKSGGQRRRKPPTFNHELNEFKNEMTPINHIANTKDLRHLLTHPLITSFIFLKWQQLSTIFYINFCLYTTFCVSMVLYILYCYRDPCLPRPIELTLYSVSLVLACGLVVRELIQLGMSSKNYVKTLVNYMELVLIVVVFVILTVTIENATVKRSLAAVAILLSIGELLLLVGSLRCMHASTHLIMLKTVSISFIKSFLLYSLIVVAFSLSFYTLLNENDGPKDAAVNVTEEADDFNRFTNEGTAVLKTLVMLTGEFEAASINFKINGISYVIFLVFLFLISTVLFNLLGGLAVSDTQQILSQAELTDIMSRVEMMGRFESIALVQSDNYLKSYIKSWASKRISLFKGHLPLNKIAVQPNVENQISHCLANFPSEGNDENYDPELGDRKVLFNVSNNWQCWSRYKPMKKSIVKRAFQIIEQKISNQIEEGKEKELNERIRRIEENIASISENLKILITEVNVQARV